MSGFCNSHLGRVKRICVFEHSVMTTFTAHAQPFGGARDLAFCLKVPVDSLLVWASSGGSGETARMRRLAWTFIARIGDKYQIRLMQPICNHCPPPTGNSKDNDFSSITALLKVLHCGDLLRVIALLFIIVNSTGVYRCNITSPALTQHCGGGGWTQNVTVPHISPTIPPPIPVGGGQWLQMTGALSTSFCH